MIYVALRMLFGDKSKSLLLLCALAFSTVLMTQQTAIFFGILRWATSMLRNSKATIWVVDKNTEQVNETKAIRDIDLLRIRSVGGVLYAEPIIFSIIQVRMPNGLFKNVQLIGLDSTTLTGVPKRIDAGSPAALFQDKTVMIDQVAIEKLSPDDAHPLGIGSSFEINDKEARVVAVCRTDRAFFGYPYVYTTASNAVKYIPPQRRLLSYVIVQPQEGIQPEFLARKIERETGMRAYLEPEFAKATIIWFFKNTGIPISVGTSVIYGFIIGMAIAGQTFYAFILENVPNFCMLKAMGATNKTLLKMMIVQSSVVGLMGYGFGMGLVGIFGRAVMERGQPPFYLNSLIFVTTFIAISLISFVSVFFAARKIKKIEPAQVFRA